MAIAEKKLATSVSAATHERVKYLADQEKRSVSNWLRAVIEQRIESGTDAPTHSGANREPSTSD